MPPIEALTTTRWRHPVCRKSWSSKSQAQRHVTEGCIKDPETRACPTCDHDDRGSDGSYAEPGIEPGCQLGVPERDDELYVRHCPMWELRRPFGAPKEPA